MTTDAAVLWIAVPAALLGAASFGLGSAVQQRATKRVEASAPLDPRLLVHLARQPVWAVGVATVVAGLGLQLLALAFGPLTMVQPLVATSLLFAAVFSARLARRRVPGQVLLGCLLCVAGLSAFLLLARPGGDAAVLADPPVPWTLIAALTAVVAGSLAFGAGAAAGSTARVLGLSLATGVVFGINAGLMKVVAGQLRAGGVTEVLGSWVLYTVCVVGPIGFLLSQNAFQAGPLAPALAVIRSTEPVIGVIVGVVWLGEQVRSSPAVLVGELLAAATLVLGIWLLAHRTHAGAGRSAVRRR